MLLIFYRYFGQIPSKALPKLILAIPSSLQSPRHVLALPTPGPPSFGDLSFRLIFLGSVQVSISSYCLYFWDVCVQAGTLGLFRGSSPICRPSRPSSHLVLAKCLLVDLSEFWVIPFGILVECNPNRGVEAY